MDIFLPLAKNSSILYYSANLLDSNNLCFV